MFCKKCGNEQNDNVYKCSKCGSALRKRWIPIAVVISLLTVVIAIVSTYIAYHYIELSKLNNKLEESVGRDSGYTETILRIENESDSMTYGELFKLCEKSIDDRTNLIVELRGLYPSVDNQLRDSLIEHLSAENEMIRQKVSFYRKQLSLNKAIELYQDHIKDIRASRYGYYHYKIKLLDLNIEVLNSISEILSNGTQYIETYSKLVSREKELAKNMDRSGLRYVRIFEKYEAKNMETTQKAINYAKSIKL